MTRQEAQTKLLLLSVATLLLSAGMLRVGTADWLEALLYIVVGVFLLVIREWLKDKGGDQVGR